METITIEMIKAHIAATYDVVPYIEWSKQAEQELEIAAYIINMNPLEMYHCQLPSLDQRYDMLPCVFGLSLFLMQLCIVTFFFTHGAIPRNAALA